MERTSVAMLVVFQLMSKSLAADWKKIAEDAYCSNEEEDMQLDNAIDVEQCGYFAEINSDCSVDLVQYSSTPGYADGHCYCQLFGTDCVQEASHSGFSIYEREPVNFTVLAENKQCGNEGDHKRLDDADSFEECALHAQADRECGTKFLQYSSSVGPSNKHCYCQKIGASCKLADSESGFSVYTSPQSKYANPSAANANVMDMDIEAIGEEVMANMHMIVVVGFCFVVLCGLIVLCNRLQRRAAERQAAKKAAKPAQEKLQEKIPLGRPSSQYSVVSSDCQKATDCA